MKRDNYIKTEDLYRIIGVRQNAGINDITKAYRDKIKRLSSADYADEPEYAARKKAELTKAYSILTGGQVAPLKPWKNTTAGEERVNHEERRPTTRTVKSLYERRNAERMNAERRSAERLNSERRNSGKIGRMAFSPNTGDIDTEIRESNYETYESRNSSSIPFGRSKPAPTISTSRTTGTTGTAGSNQTPQPAITAIVVVICIIVSILVMIISSVSDDDDIYYEEGTYNEYVAIDVGDDEPLLVEEDDYDIINKLMNAPESLFDFNKYIESETSGGVAKDFDYNITDEDEEVIEECVNSMCYELGFYDQPTVVDAIMEESGYYDNSKPSDRAVLFTKLLAAPSPEDLNGKVSQFTEEPISNYVTYWQYIADVVYAEAYEVMN